MAISCFFFEEPLNKETSNLNTVSDETLPTPS